MTKSIKGVYEMHDLELSNSERKRKTQKVAKIHDYLYNFSIEKLEECMGDPEIAFLFLRYWQKSNENVIESNETMSKNVDSYRTAYERLVKQCKTVLKTTHQVPST